MTLQPKFGCFREGCKGVEGFLLSLCRHKAPLQITPKMNLCYFIFVLDISVESHWSQSNLSLLHIRWALLARTSPQGTHCIMGYSRPQTFPTVMPMTHRGYRSFISAPNLSDDSGIYAFVSLCLSWAMSSWPQSVPFLGCGLTGPSSCPSRAMGLTPPGLQVLNPNSASLRHLALSLSYYRILQLGLLPGSLPFEAMLQLAPCPGIASAWYVFLAHWELLSSSLIPIWSSLCPSWATGSKPQALPSWAPCLPGLWIPGPSSHLALGPVSTLFWALATPCPGLSTLLRPADPVWLQPR